MTGIWSVDLLLCVWLMLLKCINFRGTDEFTLEVSYDTVVWKTVVQDRLPDASGSPDCHIPLVAFDVTAQARYVRFTAVSYFYHGAGLNYITWKPLVF